MLMFHARFPEVAERETRTVTVFGGSELPPGHYSFIDYYCEDAGCDCRRARIAVFSDGQGPLASLDYGWEDRAFYADWMGGDDDTIDDLVGPCLAPMQPQTPLAGPLLKLFADMLEDIQYRERIVRHYRMFKASLAEKRLPRSASKRVGRNEACPCGSGRKFKVCCLGRAVEAVAGG